jgi:hypothetical protein
MVDFLPDEQLRPFVTLEPPASILTWLGRGVLISTRYRTQGWASFYRFVAINHHTNQTPLVNESTLVKGATDLKVNVCLSRRQE